MNETNRRISDLSEYIDSLEILTAGRIEELEARVAQLETPRKYFVLYWLVRADDITRVEHGPYIKRHAALRQGHNEDHLICVETHHPIFQAGE